MAQSIPLADERCKNSFYRRMLKRQCHSMEGRLEFLLLGRDGCEASILKA